jgi:hypothetical protein
MGIAQRVLRQRRVVEFGFGDVGHGLAILTIRPSATALPSTPRDGRRSRAR